MSTEWLRGQQIENKAKEEQHILRTKETLQCGEGSLKSC